jgi:hypothetical protein
VAALAHRIGTILGQVVVTAKSNEFPAAREVLKGFASLAGAVITTVLASAPMTTSLKLE